MPAASSRATAVEVVGATKPSAHLGAAFGELSGDVVHVLVGERHAVQRARGVSARQRGIGCGRGRERLVGLMRTKALSVGCQAAILASSARVTSTEETFFDRIAAATSASVSAEMSLTGRSPAVRSP